MDAKVVDVVARAEIKSQVRERGLTVSNLLIRAQRMQEEVTVDVDFHKYNKAVWDPEKHERWGQKNGRRWPIVLMMLTD